MKEADHERLPDKLYLFYSNRRPEGAPFLESLNSLEKSNPNFHLIAAIPRPFVPKQNGTGILA